MRGFVAAACLFASASAVFSPLYVNVATELCSDTETNLYLNLFYDTNVTCLNKTSCNITAVVPGNNTTYGNCFTDPQSFFWENNTVLPDVNTFVLDCVTYEGITHQSSTTPWRIDQIPGNIFEGHTVGTHTNNCSADPMVITPLEQSQLFTTTLRNASEPCSYGMNRVLFDITDSPEFFCDAAPPVIHKHIQTANQVCEDETTLTYLHLTFSTNTSCNGCNITAIVPGDSSTYGTCFTHASVWNFRTLDSTEVATQNDTNECNEETKQQVGFTPWKFTDIPAPNTTHVLGVHVGGCEDEIAVNLTLGLGIAFMHDQTEVCEITAVAHYNNTYDINMTRFNITTDDHDLFCDAKVTTTSTTTTAAPVEAKKKRSKTTTTELILWCTGIGVVALGLIGYLAYGANK